MAMENKELKIIKNSICICIIVTQILVGFVGWEILDRIDDLEKKLLKQNTLISNIDLPNNFNYAYDILHDYNKNIDTNTVIEITNVANYFNLSDNKKTFKLVLGQILLESKGNHLSSETNKVLTSSQGALGIGQIIPNSGYGYLVKYAKDLDRLKFKNLGCDDISFVFNDDLSKSKKVKQMKDWLCNKTNNIALWGFIMNKNIEICKGNVSNALIVYSSGIGGYRTFKDSGGNVKNHDYIVSINSKLNKNNGN